MEQKRRPYIPGESLKGVTVEEIDKPLIEAIEEDPTPYSDVEPGDLGHIITMSDGKKVYKAPRDDARKYDEKTERRVNVQYQPFDTHESPAALGTTGLEAIVEERLRQVITKEKITSIIDKIIKEIL